MSSSWRKEAIGLFCAARERATETSNTYLHQACCRAIEAMVAEGSWVPEELRSYARETRRAYGAPAPFLTATVTGGYLG
jgi:hypothetical protein